MPRFPALDYDALPVDRISKALGVELSPGPVHLGPRAHRHAAIDHANDYPFCLPLLGHALRDPTYAGQAPHHVANFELIHDAPGLPDAMLVAVGLVPDRAGRYRVKSIYLIGRSKVAKRILTGRLRRVPS